MEQIPRSTVASLFWKAVVSAGVVWGMLWQPRRSTCVPGSVSLSLHTILWRTSLDVWRAHCTWNIDWKSWWGFISVINKLVSLCETCVMMLLLNWKINNVAWWLLSTKLLRYDAFGCHAMFFCSCGEPKKDLPGTLCHKTVFYVFHLSWNDPSMAVSSPCISKGLRIMFPFFFKWLFKFLLGQGRAWINRQTSRQCTFWGKVCARGNRNK